MPSKQSRKDARHRRDQRSKQKAKIAEKAITEESTVNQSLPQSDPVVEIAKVTAITEESAVNQSLPQSDPVMEVAKGTAITEESAVNQSPSQSDTIVEVAKVASITSDSEAEETGKGKGKGKGKVKGKGKGKGKDKDKGKGKQKEEDKVDASSQLVTANNQVLAYIRGGGSGQLSPEDQDLALEFVGDMEEKHGDLCYLLDEDILIGIDFDHRYETNSLVRAICLIEWAQKQKVQPSDLLTESSHHLRVNNMDLIDLGHNEVWNFVDYKDQLLRKCTTAITIPDLQHDYRDFLDEAEKYFKDNPSFMTMGGDDPRWSASEDPKYIENMRSSFPIPYIDETETITLGQKIDRYFHKDSDDVLNTFEDVEGKHSAGVNYPSMMIDPVNFRSVLSQDGRAEFGMKVTRHMTTFNFVVWKPKPAKRVVTQLEIGASTEASSGQVYLPVDEDDDNNIDIELGRNNAQYVFVHANWEAVRAIHVTNLSAEKVKLLPEALKKQLKAKPNAFRKFIDRTESLGATPFLLDLHFQPEHLIGEFFEIGTPDSAKKFVHQMNAGHIKVLIQGTHKTEQQLETIAHIFSYQSSVRTKNHLSLSDPLRKFHSNPGRMVFKEDQLKADEGENEKHGYYIHYTFHGINEVSTVHAIGLIQEKNAVLDSTTAYEESIHEIPLIRTDNGGDRLYVTWLPFPSDEQSNFRLKENDRLLAVFHNLHNPDFEDHAWSVQILPPIAGGPSDMIPALIKRPLYSQLAVDKVTKEEVIVRAYDPTKLKIADLRGAVREMNVQVAQAPVNKCRLKISSSDKIFRQNFAAIERLACPSRNDRDSEFRTCFRRIYIGKGVKDLVKRNGIASITAQFPDFWEKEGFPANKAQKQAFKQMTQALAGVCIINGPPGTGKTHVHKELIGMALRLKEHYSSVVITNTNEGVDDLTAKFRDLIAKGKKTGEIPKHRYVVRLHSTTTEKAIRDSLAVYMRPKTHEPIQLLDETDEEVVDQLFQVSVLLGKIVRENQKMTYEGIRDKRVKHIEDSIGYVMLKKCGIISDQFLTDDDYEKKWQGFRTSYFMLASGSELSKGDKETFAEQANELYTTVIREASVVVTTVTGFGAARPLKALQSHARLLVIDEAMAIREHDMLPIIGTSFTRLDLVLFCGDFFQLGPRPACDDPELCAFYLQEGVSLPSRMARYGWEVVYFTEQNRMAPDIRKVVSVVSYGNTLTDAPGVALECRYVSQLARSFIAAFQKSISKRPSSQKSNVIVLDFDGKSSHVEINANHSRYCDAFIIFLMNNILKILEAPVFGKNPTFAIITPYAAERNHLLTAKAVMEMMQPEKAILLGKLSIGTIDGFQGREFDVVFTTIPVAATGGHTNLKRRQAVQLSRAKHMMILLVSNSKISEARNVSNIQKLVRVAGDVTIKIDAENLHGCPYYTPEKSSVLRRHKTGLVLTKGERLESFTADYTAPDPHPTATPFEPLPEDDQEQGAGSRQDETESAPRPPPKMGKTIDAHKTRMEDFKSKNEGKLDTYIAAAKAQKAGETQDLDDTASAEESDGKEELGTAAADTTDTWNEQIQAQWDETPQPANNEQAPEGSNANPQAANNEQASEEWDETPQPANNEQAPEGSNANPQAANNEQASDGWDETPQPANNEQASDVWNETAQAANNDTNVW